MLGIQLDRGLDRSLGSQLCDQLRARILSGALAGGARLLSTRELARELCLSRTLVLVAFEQLQAEGYVEGIRGAGSFVRPGSALPPGASDPRSSADATPIAAERARPPAPRSPARLPRSARGLPPVDFRTGSPALELFPREAWARALADAARRLPLASIGYGEGAGLPSLREETASYLFRSRGLRARPEDIFITSGCSQALGLISRILLRCSLPPGGRPSGLGRAVLENPCQPALSGLLRREGVELVAGKVDAEGLDPRSLPRDRSALAFVTPSHQFPLGSVLSAPRRAELLDWARATDSIVVEDDFDGEFRYGGAPLLPLRESDPERVVYTGSFSKAFSPGLRLGYAIVPPSLREAWKAGRELMDIHSCAYSQAAMAAMLGSGAFDRHVRRMKRAYASRRAALLAGVAAMLGGPGAEGGAEALGEAAGLHVALRFSGPRFRRIRFDEATVSRIASAGAIVYPASRYAFAPCPGIERILLLGYGNLSESDIARGLSALASALGLAGV